MGCLARIFLFSIAASKPRWIETTLHPAAGLVAEYYNQGLKQYTRDRYGICSLLLLHKG
jgi:hypothetical protein